MYAGVSRANSPHPRPPALGATVPLPLASLGPKLHPSWSPLAKTKFSMVLPEVEQSLQEWGTKSVVIFGIEVSWALETSAEMCG